MLPPLCGIGMNAQMSTITAQPRAEADVKTEPPRLHKVILVDEDFAPREFVVTFLKAEFRMNEDQAN